MYFRALILSGCVALTGCQTTQVVEQVPAASAQMASSIEGLSKLPVTLPSSVVVDITQGSQILTMNGIESPVAAFEIPANRGELDITITSLIEDSVFYPSAVIMSKSGKILDSYQGADFEYRKPRLNLGDRIEAEKRFFPPYGEESVYLIVYTTKEALKGTTGVIHPARLDAEARGNYLPEIKDIPKPHANTGRIEVAVKGAGFIRIGTEAEKTDTPPAKRIAAPQPETQTFYHNAIRAAVEANDLNKALSLLEEAKALNIEGAQQIFVQAVNKK
ncbi:MalM family protein [Vibrio sp. NTOU-M3]|uniref:MalM family protein n=1 Tax=Vibrio sp. NTOU-M3 TaxID=3234954 RepID=UPI00349FB902